MGKQTLAIIGETGKFCPALTEAAMQKDWRLLFITREESNISALKKQLEGIKDPAEVDFSSCEKDGCWEADVIAFTHTKDIDPGLLKRIKQVATQKIVLVISHEPVEPSKLNFRELLPHSKVVELRLTDKKFSIIGNNKEATAVVQEFFEAAGYNQNQ